MASISQDEGESLVPERRSTLSVLRSVVLSLTHVVEDSTEFVSASVREELERFRIEMARHALSIIAVVAGTALVSAGVAMFVSKLVGSWSLTLVLFGGLYLAIGFVIHRYKSPNGD
ncbi:MAG TPA: hypothetical protein VEK15_07425 [Vicinamibacteria bacterium]|nr:hypothetical protein [Vicinamibacteria bacterium]